MHPRTKIVQRNLDQITSHQSLIVYGPPENDDIGVLDPTKVHTVDYRVYNSLSSKDNVVEFGLIPLEGIQYDAALIYIPKSKAELSLAFAFACSQLTHGADIYLVGEKKSGISSASKKLNEYSDNASKIDSAAHCQLWHANLDVSVSPFELDDWLEVYELTVKDISLKVASLAGVFSQGELDDATRLLLDNMFYKLKGRVLDFGCGSGVIGCYTKLLNPEINLELVDLSWLALESAKRTCELNGVDALIYASDGWNEVKGRVNAVVTNPPFHQGVATEYNTTETFIKRCAEKMAKHAPLLLVANNFLRYSPIIESTLGRCDIHAENSKFRVYKAYR